MSSRVRIVIAFCLPCFLALFVGCGGPPPLHPVTGKITLKGKAHARLIVYFRPADGKVSEYTLGVGETDKDGILALRSAGGPGLKAGVYKVTFTYLVTQKGVALPLDSKPEEAGEGNVREMIPPPYDDATSQAETPVSFTVQPGDNTFDFDIPATSK